jgi:hypothetical protein
MGELRDLGFMTVPFMTIFGTVEVYHTKDGFETGAG